MAAFHATHRPLLLIVSMIGAAHLAGATRADAKTRVDPNVTEITATIDDQFAGFRDTKRVSTVYAKDAMIAMTGGAVTPQVNKLTDADGKWTLFGPSKVGKHKVRDLRVVFARDGQSAWASFNVKVSVDGLSKTGVVDLRASELFVKNGDRWQVRAAAWSTARPAAAIVKSAKAGTLAQLETVFDQDLGDRDVLAAVRAFASDGLDVTAKARKDIVGIGIGAGERVIGGKQLAAKLAKDWGSQPALSGAIWGVTEGTTACATVNVEVARGGAIVPARLFVVFERVDGTRWSPALVHFAAAPPS
jgi:hypothetical protein